MGRNILNFSMLSIGVAALSSCGHYQLRQGEDAPGTRSPEPILLRELSQHGSLMGWGSPDLEFEPTTMEELALGPGGAGYDAIVVGVVEEYLQDLAFATPTEWAALATEGVPIGLDDPSMSYREFRVEAQLVILNHGDIASAGEFVLRRHGTSGGGTPDLTYATQSWYTMDRPGERYLYFLEEDPDDAGTYWVMYEKADRLVLGTAVSYSDGARSPLAFTTETPPIPFLSALRTQVAISYATPTP